MQNIQITISLPANLVKQAEKLDMLSDENIAALLQEQIHAKLEAMAADSEIADIDLEFKSAEADGLNNANQTG